MRSHSVAVALALLLAAGPALAATYPAHDWAGFGKSAKLEVVGTDALPKAGGDVKIKPVEGGVEIEIAATGLETPSRFGPEFLTYVVWAVAPGGGATSLGELPPGVRSKLETRADLPSFALLVSAEPYLGVTVPSDWIVATARPDEKVASQVVSTPVEVSPRAPEFYRFGRSEVDLALVLKADRKTPSELVQARNAVEIARRSGGERHAADGLEKARALLLKAEQLERVGGSKHDIAEASREAIAAAETARGTSIEKAAEAARIEKEHEAERARATEAARKEAEEAARERAAAEKRLAEEQARRQAAEAQAAEAAKAREAAEARAAEATKMRDEATSTAKSAEEARAAVEAARAREAEETAGSEPAATGETAKVAQAAEFEAERARIAAERAKLEAERAKMDADLEVERARMAAEQANLAAQRSAESLAKEREEGAAVRAEAEAAKDAAERARTDAERARRDAEIAAERARMEMERANREADLRAAEAAQAARLAEVERQKAAANADALVAMEAERARLQAEIAERQRVLEAERLAMGTQQQETAQRQAAMEAERAKHEAERAELQAEMERQRLALETERAALERARAEDRLAMDRAREADRLAMERAREAAAAEEAERQRLAEERMREEMARKMTEEQARLEEEFRRRRDEQAIVDRAARRQRLLTQLTEVLDAEDSQRGLLVRMSEASFDPGRFELKPAVREKLARVAGILVANPSLRAEIEGHTDSTGKADTNQVLSEKRAAAVRDYLVSQGVAPEAVAARGFGSERPVDTNDTAEGRRKNRRVDLILSGDAIGTAPAPEKAVAKDAKVP